MWNLANVVKFANDYYQSVKGMESEKYVVFDRSGVAPVMVLNPHLVATHKLSPQKLVDIKKLYVVRYEICSAAHKTSSKVVLRQLKLRFTANELELQMMWGMVPNVAQHPTNLFPNYSKIQNKKL